MIKLVEYTPEHLSQIKLKACHEGEKPQAIEGQALTLTYDDEPVAIFIWRPVAPSVLQVSSFISEQVKQYPLTFHKSVLHLLDYAFEEFRLQRIQMSVRCGFTEGWDWALSLRFRCEGIMKCYGPDKSDYWLFARVAA